LHPNACILSKQPVFVNTIRKVFYSNHKPAHILLAEYSAVIRRLSLLVCFAAEKNKFEYLKSVFHLALMRITIPVLFSSL
jgi:hypothetical protein